MYSYWVRLVNFFPIAMAKHLVLGVGEVHDVPPLLLHDRRMHSCVESIYLLFRDVRILLQLALLKDR